MTWNVFLSGTGNVARITALFILNVFMFLLNLTFSAIKIVFFVVISFFTLGKLGAGTMDLGGRRR